MMLFFKISPLILLLILTVTSTVSANRGGTPRYIYPPVQRVVAVGDIHADPYALVSVLFRMDLIDENGTWKGGETHLVLPGDIVGKGDDSRSCLDFLYLLMPQAEAAKGRVHLLIGNHEIYQVEGTPHAPSLLEQQRYWDYGPDGLVDAFQKLSSIYAQELRRRNVFTRIGRTLFVHADLGKELIEHPKGPRAMGRINTQIRRHIAARQIPHSPRQQRDADLEMVLNKQTSPVNSRFLLESEVSKQSLKIALAHLKARRLVLGHTPTQSGLIESRYHDRVWYIDTRMSQAMAVLYPEQTHLTALEIIDDEKVIAHTLEPIAGADQILARVLGWQDNCPRRLLSPAVPHREENG